MAAPTGDVPGSDEESPGTSQDKRTAPRDEETDQPRKRLRIDSEGTHGQQEVQSSLLPDDDQLYYIMENTGSKWKNLAWKLGFTLSEIEGFEEEQELRDRCMKMLTTWQQKMGNSGTVCALKEALEAVGLKNIADNLDLYRGPESSPKRIKYSDNQQVAEQEKQDKTEIQIGNMSQPGIVPVDWQAIAMAALQGRDVSEPIKVGKKTNLKIIASRPFNESMRFGFTSRDPNSMTMEELPPHSYPTLAQQPGFWVKPLPASLAHHGCVVSFTLKSSGDVTFAVDGEDKGLFFSTSVDVLSRRLWAVVDIHDSTVAVQFVGLEVVSEAFDKRIHEGDQVQMSVKDMETLRYMQDGHGGFNADMDKAVGQVGIAVKIDNDEDVHVSFPLSINRRWCMNPATLRKVDRPDIRFTAIIRGDLVKITADLEKLMSVQKKKGFWEDGMEKVPGKIGRAVGVGQKGEIVVKVAGEETEMMIFDPQVVQRTENQGDMCVQGLHHWKSGFSKVCVKCGECTTEGAECSMKGKPLRPPGSCCGCVRYDAGCEDCGLCKSCAGVKSDEDSIRELGNRLNRLLPVHPLESTCTFEVIQLVYHTEYLTNNTKVMCTPVPGVLVLYGY
ncbi:uncharacterized protein [Branchiostoma lanceolatum]|uniref:uncharacterized protein n=1 Tax=Branchiostoma lanceolatum TaxID=7740 RepID=UPI0034538AA3